MQVLCTTTGACDSGIRHPRIALHTCDTVQLQLWVVTTATLLTFLPLPSGYATLPTVTLRAH
jgi:hypothetical protein